MQKRSGYSPSFTFFEWFRYARTLRRREWRIIFAVARRSGIRSAFIIATTPYALG